MESLQQALSDGSKHKNCEFRNKYTKVPSTYGTFDVRPTDETIEKTYKIDNVEYGNVFEETGNQKNENHSSNNSISSNNCGIRDEDNSIIASSNNCAITDEDNNIGVSELGALNDIQNGTEHSDVQSNHEESSDSDDEINIYDMKYSNDETIYQDESQYPCYQDNFQYLATNRFDCEDESDKYDYQVEEEEDANKFDDSLEENLNHIGENVSNCSNQDTQSHYRDENFKQEDPTMSELSHCSNQNNENESLQHPFQAETQVCNPEEIATSC